MMKLSILDYTPIFEGRNATDALSHTIALAQSADRLNYHRYWVAEHHQVLSVASSAPEMLMMSILENTSNMRVGSGGAMLPHYSSYKVAELFRVMEARHPNRVDLGLGRSPSFKNVKQALNEYKTAQPDFETQIDDLELYFNDAATPSHRFHQLIATPQIQTQPHMFILGSSMRSPTLAAKKGLPFVFPYVGQDAQTLTQLTNRYKTLFEENHPDRQPYIMMSTFVITASTQSQVDDLARAFHLWLLRIRYANQPKSYPSIEFAKERGFSEREQQKVAQNKKRVITGLPETVIARLQALIKQYSIDEVMILPHVYGETNRQQLIELLADANQSSSI